MFKLLFLLLFLKNNRVKIDLLFYINAELWDLDGIYHASLGIQIRYIMSLRSRWHNRASLGIQISKILSLGPIGHNCTSLLTATGFYSMIPHWLVVSFFFYNSHPFPKLLSHQCILMRREIIHVVPIWRDIFNASSLLPPTNI
jgi:hypothetical protein